MKPTWLRLLCAGALTLTSLLAHAQYSWIDDKGMRVFSDRPPPSGTPAEHILKAPGGLESAPLPAAAAPGVAADTDMPEWKKREAEFRKRWDARQKAMASSAASASSNARARQGRKLRCDVAKRESEQLMRTGSISTGKGQTTLLTAIGRIKAENAANVALRDCS